LVLGADCNCPSQCEETVYFQENSQANFRPDSLIFDRLKDTYKPIQKLIEDIANLTKIEKAAAVK